LRLGAVCSVWQQTTQVRNNLSWGGLPYNTWFDSSVAMQLRFTLFWDFM
jgi:hypothetical protein